MKIVLDLPDEEIKEVIASKARRLAIEVVSGWNFDQRVKREIESQWTGEVRNIVREAIANTPQIKEKVAAALERKILGQLTAAMAKAGK